MVVLFLSHHVYLKTEKDMQTMLFSGVVYFCFNALLIHSLFECQIFQVDTENKSNRLLVYFNSCYVCIKQSLYKNVTQVIDLKSKYFLLLTIALNATFIVVGNGIGGQSSNPGRSSLYFTLH